MALGFATVRRRGPVGIHHRHCLGLSTYYSEAKYWGKNAIGSDRVHRNETAFNGKRFGIPNFFQVFSIPPLTYFWRVVEMRLVFFKDPSWCRGFLRIYFALVVR